MGKYVTYKKVAITIVPSFRMCRVSDLMVNASSAIVLFRVRIQYNAVALQILYKNNSTLNITISKQ